MKRPKMIIFDYGHTLLYEPEFDFLRGEQAVFEYVKENPQQVTPEEVYAFGMKLFEELGKCRKLGFELHEGQMLKCKYDRFGITFTIPLDEVEKVLWTNTSAGARMPCYIAIGKPKEDAVYNEQKQYAIENRIHLNEW